MSFPITGFQQLQIQKISCFHKNAPQKITKKRVRFGSDIGNDNIKSPPLQGGVARSAEGSAPFLQGGVARSNGPKDSVGEPRWGSAGGSAEIMLNSKDLPNSLIYIKNFVIFTSYLRFKINTYGFYCHTGIIFPLRVLFIIYV